MPPRKRAKSSTPVTEVSTLRTSVHPINSIASDGSGNVFLSSDTCIYKISDGVETVVAGGDEAGYLDGPQGMFSTIAGLAVDADGCLIVSECHDYSRIRKVAVDGQVSTLAGDPGGEDGYMDGQGAEVRFEFPGAVAMDLDGNVLVTEENNNCIRKVAPDGTVSTLAGNTDPHTDAGYADGTADAMFDNPQAVAVGADGSVYVADCNNQSIRKISRDGEVSTLAGCPPEVANDVDNEVSAELSGHVDGAGDSARFSDPIALAVDIDGTIVVADSGNHCIRKVTPEGVVSTLAGPTDRNPFSRGYVDGPANKARFHVLQGVAIDMDGNVLVAESNGTTSGTTSCVRMITHTGLSRGAAVPRWPVVKPALAANLVALLDDERFADVSFGMQALRTFHTHPPHHSSRPAPTVPAAAPLAPVAPLVALPCVL